MTSVSYILPSFHNFSVITNSDSVNLFEFSEYPKVSFICFIKFGFIWTANALALICMEFAFPIPMFAPLFSVWRSSWYKELYRVIYNTASTSHCWYKTSAWSFTFSEYSEEIPFYLYCQWYFLQIWVCLSLTDIILNHLHHP